MRSGNWRGAFYPLISAVGTPQGAWAFSKHKIVLLTQFAHLICIEKADSTELSILNSSGWLIIQLILRGGKEVEIVSPIFQIEWT